MSLLEQLNKKKANLATAQIKEKQFDAKTLIEAQKEQKKELDFIKDKVREADIENWYNALSSKP